MQRSQQIECVLPTRQQPSSQTNATRVAIFEPYIFDQPYGNLRYISGLLKHLDRTKFEPVLIAPRRTEFFQTVESLGVKCVCVPAPAALLSFGGSLVRLGVLGKSRALIFLARYNLAIAQELRRVGIEIVHCNSVRAVLMVGLGARLAGCSLLWYVKGELANPILDRLAFALATQVVFQSAGVAERQYSRFLRHRRHKVAVVENGIDFDEVTSVRGRMGELLRKEIGVRSDRINFAYVGQVSPSKGLHYLLEAMSIVQREARVTLYILGDHGAEEYRNYFVELRRLVDHYQVEEIHFLGWRPDRLDILSLMDGFVLPSLSEGAPRSILEAAALAKPVVATLVGSIPDLVEDGTTGLLVRPADSGGLAAAILKLALDHELRQRMGQQGFKLVHSRYSICRNVASLQTIYTLLSRYRCSRQGQH